MSTFFVGKDVKLSMTIEVEADSYAQAERMVEDAWEGDEVFVSNYLRHAATFENDTYAGSPSDYGMTLEELSE